MKWFIHLDNSFPNPGGVKEWCKSKVWPYSSLFELDLHAKFLIYSDSHDVLNFVFKLVWINIDLLFQRLV